MYRFLLNSQRQYLVPIQNAFTTPLPNHGYAPELTHLIESSFWMYSAKNVKKCHENSVFSIYPKQLNFFVLAQPSWSAGTKFESCVQRPVTFFLCKLHLLKQWHSIKIS